MEREEVPGGEWMGPSRRTKKRRAYRQNILKLAQAQRAWAASNYEAAAAAERVLSAATEAAMGGDLVEDSTPPPPAADDESTTEEEPAPTPSEEETTEEEDTSTTEAETQEEDPKPSTSKGLAAEEEKLLEEEGGMEVDMAITDREAEELLELPEVPPEKKMYRLKGKLWAEMRAAAKGSQVALVGRNDKHKILVRDMRVLTCGKHLNDEVINGYLTLLQEEVEDEKKDKYGILSVNTMFYGPSLKAGFEKRAYWDVRRRWSNYRTLLIPIFHASLEPGASGHWGLAVVEQAKQMISYWDSLGEQKEKAQQVCDVITKYMNQRREAEGRSALRWQKMKMPAGLPKQQDKKSCGLFALVYSRFVAIQDEFFLRMAEEDPDCLRLALAAELFKGKIIHNPRVNRK